MTVVGLLILVLYMAPNLEEMYGCGCSAYLTGDRGKQLKRKLLH